MNISTTACYFSDTSEFQVPYNNSYPYPIASFRFHSGYRLDNIVRSNWNYHQDAISRGRTRLLFVYAVFIPGQMNRVFADLKNVFGSKAPTNRIVPMIDMESGAGFAGGGNHSTEAYQWASVFADWAGSQARVIGYANGNDWSQNWPNPPSWMKRHIAKYSSIPPFGDFYAWQYQGGNPNYGAPQGAPRNYPPFGEVVDGNVIYKTIEQVEQDFGITTITKPTIGDDDMPHIIFNNADPAAAALVFGSVAIPIPDGATTTAYKNAGVDVIGLNPNEYARYVNTLTYESASIAPIVNSLNNLQNWAAGVEDKMNKILDALSKIGSINITDDQASVIGQRIGEALATNQNKVTFPRYTATLNPEQE